MGILDKLRKKDEPLSGPQRAIYDAEKALARQEAEDKKLDTIRLKARADALKEEQAAKPRIERARDRFSTILSKAKTASAKFEEFEKKNQGTSGGIIGQGFAKEKKEGGSLSGGLLVSSLKKKKVGR